MNWGKMITNHTLMYLACEQMVIGVIQLQSKKWVRQPTNELCTKARQPMDILCTGGRQIPLEDLFVGARQLQLEDMNQS